LGHIASVRCPEKGDVGVSRTKTLTSTALFTALITVGTLYLKVPGPTGYYHLGDGLIYTAALVLGLWPAAFAAAVGSALADVLGGFAGFAVWTFLIKGLTSIVVTSVAKGKPSRNLMAMVLGAIVTVAGYAIATTVMFDAQAAMAETLGNFAQTGAGVIVGLALVPISGKALGGRQGQSQ